MSKSVETASEGEPAEPQNDIVLDFLYCDSRRVASFLSQFDDAGHLERIVEKDSSSKVKKRGYALSLGGGATVLGTGGSGTIGFNRGPESEGSEASERTYDPLWTNARTFLDFAEDRGLVQRNVATARIGQMVQISGRLSLFDLGLIQRAWGLSSVKKAMLKGAAEAQQGSAEFANRHERRKAGSITGASKEPTEADLALELITIMPHAIQAAVSSDEVSAWCTLRDEGMTVSAADLMLKHGLTIQGTWTLFGILDALPDESDFQISEGITNRGMQQMMAGASLCSIAMMLVGNLIPPVRGLLGKPETSFGMTPLLIYREVSG